MYNSLNVDIVVECVKIIVDNVRCPSCDKAEGSRLRYPCGHTVCADCVAVVEECSLCDTLTTSPNTAVLDEPLSQQANNALALLSTCQEEFNLDVYRRQRISEQLKIEKELFPECIQAPVKYFNKKRNSRASLSNKENRRPSFYAGENISPIKKSVMDKSNNYVEEWVDQQAMLTDIQPRKPFSDLNVNNQTINNRKHSTPIKKRADVLLEKVKQNIENKKETHRKRSYLKTIHSTDDDTSYSLNKYLKLDERGDSLGRINAKKLKKESDQYDKAQNKSKIQIKSDKDESGIVIDDEPIVIDDSQSQAIDKDKLAWLAVLEADKNEHSNSIIQLECNKVVRYTDDVEKTLSKPVHYGNQYEYIVNKDVILSNSIDDHNKQAIIRKVPFYKKSYLFKSCNCGNDIRINLNNKKAGQHNDYSVTIENDCFVTTINVSNYMPNTSKIISKKSTSAQTDSIGMGELKNNYFMQNVTEYEHSEKGIESVPINVNKITQSQDLFTDEAFRYPNDLVNLKEAEKHEYNKPDDILINKNQSKKSILVIDDSDSEADSEERNIVLQVTADVHRSSEQHEYSILTPVDQTEHRMLRRTRRCTPTSSDSSDKENRDPNRAKKPKFGKKDHKKKRNAFDFDAIQYLK